MTGWGLAGYQLNLTENFYLNTRAGAGRSIFRTNAWPDAQKLVIVGDLNAGVSF